MQNKFRLLITMLLVCVMAACSQPAPQATEISVDLESQEEAFHDSFHGTIDNWNQDLVLELMPQNILDEPQVNLEIGKLISLNVKNTSQYPILLSDNLGLKLLRYSNADQGWKAVANDVVIVQGANASLILTPKGIIDNNGNFSEKHLPIIPAIPFDVAANVDTVTIRAVVTGEIQDGSEEVLVGAYIDLAIQTR